MSRYLPKDVMSIIQEFNTISRSQVEMNKRILLSEIKSLFHRKNCPSYRATFILHDIILYPSFPYNIDFDGDEMNVHIPDQPTIQQLKQRDQRKRKLKFKNLNIKRNRKHYHVRHRVLRKI